MKLGLTAQNPLDALALATGLAPTPLLMSLWGMGMCRTLMTGVSLGVFTALEAGEKTAAEVATLTGCDPLGMETLLNATNGYGFTRRRHGRYALTKLAKRWVLPGSFTSLAGAIPFFYDLWELFSHMEEIVRTGQSADFHHSAKPPEFWERYMRGLATLTRVTSLEIAHRVKFKPSPTQLLDVAGGHGGFSMAFCERYPGLEAEVLDLPAAVEVGRRIVLERGMQDRVRYRSGDLREADWGEGYDVVLLFSILHNVTIQEAQLAITKAWKALRPGGTLVIFEAEHAGGDGNINQTGGFAELLFFLTSGVRAYPEVTMKQWMTDAQFHGIRSQRMLTAPMTVVLTGRKEAA